MPATTPNRGYPYPLPTDPVDIPGDMQALAEAVDDDLEVIQPQTAARPFAQIANFQPQSIPQGFQRIVEFDQVEFDNAQLSNLTSLPDRLTLPDTGLYWIHGEIGLPLLINATNELRVTLQLIVDHSSLFVTFGIAESTLTADTGAVGVREGVYNVTGLLDTSQFDFNPPIKLAMTHTAEENSSTIPVQSVKLSAFLIAE